MTLKVWLLTPGITSDQTQWQLWLFPISKKSCFKMFVVLCRLCECFLFFFLYVYGKEEKEVWEWVLYIHCQYCVCRKLSRWVTGFGFFLQLWSVTLHHIQFLLNCLQYVLTGFIVIILNYRLHSSFIAKYVSASVSLTFSLSLSHTHTHTHTYAHTHMYAHLCYSVWRNDWVGGCSGLRECARPFPVCWRERRDRAVFT